MFHIEIPIVGSIIFKNKVYFLGIKKYSVSVLRYTFKIKKHTIKQEYSFRIKICVTQMHWVLRTRKENLTASKYHHFWTPTLEDAMDWTVNPSKISCVEVLTPNAL